MLRKIAFVTFVLFVFLIPVEEIYVIPGFGTVTRLAGLIAAGVWALAAVVTDRIRKPHLFHWLLIIFVLWNLTSTFWTIGLERTTDRLVTYAQLIGLVWIMWDLATEEFELNIVMQAFVLGACVTVADTMRNFLTGTFAVSTSGGVSTGRFSATGFNPNDLGLMLLLSLPVAWYLILNGDNRHWVNKLLSLLNLIFIPTAIFAILVTASRGSFAILLPTLLLMSMMVFRLNWPLRITTFAIGAVCLIVILPYVPQSAIERLSETTTSVQQGDLSGRIDVWSQGMSVFAERPLIGVGSNAFRLAIDLGKAPHNSYLSVLVDLGLIGLILFGAIIVTTLYQAMQHSKWQRLLWTTVLVAWFLGNMVHNWENRKPTWFFLSLVVVSANVVSVSVERKPISKEAYDKQQVIQAVNEAPAN